MGDIIERYIKNPDFKKEQFLELLGCASDPEAAGRLREEAVRVQKLQTILWRRRVYQRTDRIYQLLQK